jgi:streptomycin 6-kinase
MPNKSAAAARARHLAAAWGLELGHELSGATCSVVYQTFDANREPAVLKMPFSHAEERESGPVLRAFSGHGGVALLKHDPETGGILMPKLIPGYTLESAKLSDDEEVAVCAGIVKELRGAPFVQSMTVERWFKELFDGDTNTMVEEGRRIYRWLAETTISKTLMHGDLHHYNMLRHGDKWLAIDPKGIVGDPSFEIAAFMQNPFSRELNPELMQKRLRLFVDLLGDPPERLWGWCFAETVLSCRQGDNPCFSEGWFRNSEALWEIRKEFLKTA